MNPSDDPGQRQNPATALSSRMLAAAVEKGKQLSTLTAALKKLADERTLDHPQKVNAALQTIQESDPAALGLEINLDELLETIGADQAQRSENRRMTFGRALTDAASERGVVCSLLTSDPMELALSPFTVTVDLARNLATLRYARLAVEELPAAPDRVMDAREKHLKQLESGWAPEQFFDALREAYQILRIRQRLPNDARVALTDLLGHLALAFQGKKFLGDPSGSHYRDYGRARFAYDLARLRRAGLLERNDWRLSLGTATGTATKNKKDVLYIEEGGGRGQYYATLWFVAAGKDRTQ